MPKPSGPPAGTSRRARRVAGQRRVVGDRPTAYPAPPVEPAVGPPPAVSPPVTAPPREPRPGWRDRVAALRRRFATPAAEGAEQPAATRRAGIVALALLAVIVILGTLTGLYLQGYLHARAVASARDDALQAAKVGVPLFASYNYKTFDADVARAEKYLTPAYRKTYAEFQSKAVRTTVIKYKASVSAELAADGAGAGVISAGPSRAEVLVFLNQTQANTKIPAPRLSPARLRVEMRKVGGHWLIQQVSEF
ncbi:MAG: hypothetical protein ACJ735_18055 [Actinomycetes bacterium]